MKELTLPVICRNALTIVALVKDFVYPSFLGLIERAKAHFCPNMLNSNYLNVPFLLSMLTVLANSTFEGTFSFSQAPKAVDIPPPRREKRPFCGIFPHFLNSPTLYILRPCITSSGVVRS